MSDKSQILDNPIDPAIQKAKINLETAPIEWPALERFFAQGSLIEVHPNLDLVDIAYKIAHDDLTAIKPLQAKGWVQALPTAQAKHWQTTEPLLWAVVVRPLVLVQEQKKSEQSSGD